MSDHKDDARTESPAIDEPQDIIDAMEIAEAVSRFFDSHRPQLKKLMEKTRREAMEAERRATMH
jgi:hypothetical protein